MELHEPAIAYSKQKMTVKEYLAFENESSEKHEYYRGEIDAMSGKKVMHNEIVMNTTGVLTRFLTAKPFKTCNSNQHI